MAGSTSSAGHEGPLSAEETARMAEHISGLVKAGLTLSSGLAVLGEELPAGRLRTSLLELGKALERGLPLDEAMALQKDRIPAHLQGLVLGGLKSGRLGDVLGRFTGYVSKGTELRRRIWLGMAYPIFTVAITVLLFVIGDAYVVTTFESIFRDFGVPLPVLTIALLKISHVVRVVWPLLVVALVGIVAFSLGSRLFLGTPGRAGLLAQMPIIGAVWRFTGWAEFCHLLALLMESHLPLPQALRLTGEGVENSGLARASDAMARGVENGEPLALAMSRRPELPRNLPRLIRWAGDNNATAELLHTAGEMYEARATSQATFAGTLIAVLAAVFVLVGVFIAVIGLFLPLLTLISKLSG